MRTSIKVTAIIVAIFIFITIAFFVMYEMETTQSDFETYEELTQKASLTETGWIPAWMPKSAKSIGESHNIDTGEVWIEFIYEKKDPFLNDFCKLTNKNVVSIPSSQSIEKFPRFVKEAHKKISEPNNLTLYVCQDRYSKRYLAIDESTMTGYIWGQAE